MANRGMPNYEGTAPSYGALRPDGSAGGTSKPGTRHLGSRHPPVRGLYPRTAGMLVGEGVPGGSAWGTIGGSARPASGQMWPRS